MRNKFKIAIIDENGENVRYIGCDDNIVTINNGEIAIFDNIKQCVDNIKRARQLLDINESDEFIILPR